MANHPGSHSGSIITQAPAPKRERGVLPEAFASLTEIQKRQVAIALAERAGTRRAKTDAKGSTKKKKTKLQAAQERNASTDQQQRTPVIQDALEIFKAMFAGEIPAQGL